MDNPNQQDFTPLFGQELYRDYQEYLLKIGPNQHLLNNELVKATESQDLNLVQNLLLQGANPNPEYYEGFLPLDVAIRLRNLPIVAALVEAGAKKEIISNNDGRTPLLDAVNAGSIDVVKYLCEQGANPYQLNGKNRDTLLHEACLHQNIEMVTFVLSLLKDVNINVQNYFGETPLHAVCHFGKNFLTAELLLEQGANIEAKNSKGETPLYKAAFIGCPKMLVRLLAAGANKHHQNNEGKSPLDVVIGNFLYEPSSLDSFEEDEDENKECKNRLFCFFSFMSDKEMIDAKNKYTSASFHSAIEEFEKILLTEKTTITAPYCPAFSSQSKDVVMQKEAEGLKINHQGSEPKKNKKDF